MKSTNTLPYLGSKICLISNMEIRYEGILYNINTADSTVGLKSVRCYGTEGRKIGSEEIPPHDNVYDFIIFKGKDIKDLTVSEPAPPADPAIVAINSLPNVEASVPTNVSQPTAHFSTDPQMLQHHMMDPQVSHIADQRGSYLMNQGQLPQRMMHRDMDPYSSHSGGNMYNGHRHMDYSSGRQRTGGTGQFIPSHVGRSMYSGQNRRGGYTHYRNRSGGYNGGHRRIIGELKPQPNLRLKCMVEKEFNFEEANLKFDKSAAIPASEYPSEHKESTKEGETTTTTAAATATTEGTTTEGATGAAASTVPVTALYDKQSSFFDNISCEALDRKYGAEIRTDRTKQHQLDVETFGPAANQATRSGRGGGRMMRRMGNMGGSYCQPVSGTQGVMGGASHLGMGGYQHMPLQTQVQYGQSRF